MSYFPHILQVKTTTSQKNEFGKAISSTEIWTTVCRCRCDDNSTKEFHTDNGGVFRPSYHVVCQGQLAVKAGTKVQCIDEDGTVRGSGDVYESKNLNFLNYSELWM